MKAAIAAILVLALGACHAPGKYIVSRAEGENVLLFQASVPGAFSIQRKFFLTSAPDPTRFITPPIVESAYGDGLSPTGDGIGYHCTFTIVSEDAAALIDLEASWRGSTDSGKCEALITIPYFRDTQGQKGKLSYRASWSKKPNQSLEPTSGAAR